MAKPPSGPIEQPRWHVPVGRQPCTNHPAVRAVDRCDLCGQPFCAACFHNVRRWRICAACLPRLNGDQTRRPVGQRLRRIVPDLAAALAFGLFFLGVAVTINHLLGPAASDAAMAGAARAIGHEQQTPTPHMAALRLTSDLAPGPPPATIFLTGSHFQHGEQVLIIAELSGVTAAGQQVSFPLDHVVESANISGDLRARLTIAPTDHVDGPYRLHIEATGEGGSTAMLDVTSGMAAPPPPQ